MSSEKQAIGFIGAGNMAYGLIKGMSGLKPDAEVFIYDTDPLRAEFVKDIFKVNSVNSIGEIIQKCGIVFIAVKPGSVESVLEVIVRELNDFKENKDFPIFISIAGGIKIGYIEEVLSRTLKNISALKIVRVMPNINSLVGKGMSAMCRNGNVSEKEIEMVSGILGMSSKIIALEEKYFDAVTALSGSGPAYIFMIAEGLIEAGVKLGLPRDVAKTLSIQTLLGSAELLNSTEFSKISTKDLKDMVTSPGGTTAYGLAELEKGRIKYVLDSAVNAAYLRAKGLV